MADVQSGGAQIQGEAAEDAAVVGNPVLTGGRYDATPRTLDDGDVGAVALDPDGAVHIADGGNSITIDGTVSVSGTVTVDTELPTAAALADATSNPTVPIVGAGNLAYNGTTWDRVRSAGDNADSVATATLGRLSANNRNYVFNGTTWDRQRGNTTGAFVHGSTAHDAVDAGNPIKVGGKAYNFDGTVPGTAVAENDRANFITDVYGRQFVETAHPNYWSVSADYASAQTNTSVKAAPGAGLKLYVTDIVISNGATAGNITLLNGSGGTVLFEIYPAANGGVAMPFRTPIALSANTALVITSTTVTTHTVTISGYIAP